MSFEKFNHIFFQHFSKIAPLWFVKVFNLKPNKEDQEAAEKLNIAIEQNHSWLVDEVCQAGWLHVRFRKQANWTNWAKRLHFYLFIISH